MGSGVIGLRPSGSLYEYGQVQRIVMGMNMLTGATIWGVAGATEEELAKAEVYGGLINAIHAEFWAIPLCLGAAVHLIGQVVNGDKRLRPWVTPMWRLIGSLVCFAVLSAFTLGGLFAPLALFTTVHFVQSFVFSGLVFWFVLLAIKDLRAGLGARGALCRQKI